MTSTEITNEMQAKLRRFEHEMSTVGAKETMRQIVNYYNDLDAIYNGYHGLFREIKFHDNGTYEIVENPTPNPFETTFSSHD